MKAKILTSLALASLISLYFVGCSSEPKSVEELKKLSDDELKKMQEECFTKKGNSVECENIRRARLSKSLNSQEYTPIKPAK